MTVHLFNETPYPAFGFETELYDDREYFCLAVKASFDLTPRGALRLREEHDPIELGDRYAGEPGASSLLAATDLIPRRLNTDVVIIGQAKAPKGAAAEHWLAGMKVGNIHKIIQLTGPRTWHYRMIGGWKLSPPQRTTSVPLLYELAYGGERPTRDDEKRDVWAPNPIGRGYVGRHRWETDREWPAPQLLGPRDILPDTPGKGHTYGFGPIPGDWAPRVERIGTTDETWRQTVAPHLPADFDLRFFNCAPDDQQAQGFLRGDEKIALSGLLQEEIYTFRLPDWEATALMVDHDNIIVSLDMDLSGVNIDLDRRVATLVWRLTTPADHWKQASLSLMAR